MHQPCSHLCETWPIPHDPSRLPRGGEPQGPENPARKVKPLQPHAVLHFPLLSTSPTTFNLWAKPCRKSIRPSNWHLLRSLHPQPETPTRPTATFHFYHGRLLNICNKTEQNSVYIFLLQGSRYAPRPLAVRWRKVATQKRLDSRFRGSVAGLVEPGLLCLFFL